MKYKLATGVLSAVLVLSSLPAMAQLGLNLGGGAKAGPVDINVATEAQLVGAGFVSADAKAIVAQRKKNRIDNVAELLAEVSVVTPQDLVNLKKSVQVGTDLVDANATLDVVTGLVGGALGATTGLVGSTLGTVAGAAIDLSSATVQQLVSLGFSAKAAANLKVFDPPLDTAVEVKAVAGVSAPLVDKLLAEGKLTLGQ